MTSISTRLLFIWLLCVIIGTLAPFGVTPAGTRELELFAYGSYQQDPVDFLLNLLLFAPLGALLHHKGRHRSLRLLSIAILAGTAGVLISMPLEYLQAFRLRDSSLIDVLANTGGALMGVAADRAWGAPVKAGIHQLRVRTSSAMLAGLMAGFLIVALLISGALQARTRLSNWSLEYPLLIGNERTGDRPWRGRVFALAMTDAATSLASVRRFSAGESVALTGTPIAAFNFKGSPPYRDAAGNLPDLEWTERPDTSSDAGIRTPGRSWLRSNGPASGLANRLRKTNAFTLRVQCATDDTDQEGPARIISNSESPLLRNFTLGQLGSDLVFRLRTPDTGVNGYPLEVHLPGVFSDRRPRGILVTYDGATLLMATADTNHVSRTELTPGSSVALAIPSLHVRPEQVQMYKLAYVAALSLVPGVLLGFLGRTSSDRQLFGAAWVLAFALLLEATEMAASGRAFNWSAVAVTGGIGAVVLLVLGVTLSQPNVQRPPTSRARA